MDEEKKQSESPEEAVERLVSEIAEFIDFNIFNKIINKLTDYAEIITQGKISGIINYNFRLNSSQTASVIELLERIHAISRIYNLALKGSKDLEIEYISNIFSDPDNLENISSYVNLKNVIENRLIHEVQQYNMNMGKNNTSMAIPLNELRGHVKTFNDAQEMSFPISTKAQHGIIAASLHDAYTILMNRGEYWNDRVYMKFFYNEDDLTRKRSLLLSREPRPTIKQISERVRGTLDRLHAAMYHRMQAAKEAGPTDAAAPTADYALKGARPESFTDRMMMTPFGRQYGGIIERSISAIFNPSSLASAAAIPESEIGEGVATLYQAFKLRSDLSRYRDTVVKVADHLIAKEYGVKTFAEKFLYFDKKEPFTRFFSGKNQEQIEQFLHAVFNAYFEERFSTLFRYIKSLDVKKFACAFIIKRIYLRVGENLTNFGYFLIKVIARAGGIRT